LRALFPFLAVRIQPFPGVPNVRLSSVHWFRKPRIAGVDGSTSSSTGSPAPHFGQQAAQTPAPHSGLLDIFWDWSGNDLARFLERSAGTVIRRFPPCAHPNHGLFEPAVHPALDFSLPQRLRDCHASSDWSHSHNSVFHVYSAVHRLLVCLRAIGNRSGAPGSTQAQRLPVQSWIG